LRFVPFVLVRDTRAARTLRSFGTLDVASLAACVALGACHSVVRSHRVILSVTGLIASSTPVSAG
jgi:hypothetical protein